MTDVLKRLDATIAARLGRGTYLLAVREIGEAGALTVALERYLPAE